MISPENITHVKYIVALVLLSVGILFALIRAVRGPRIADHIVGINMTGTLAIMVIAILSRVLHESYLLDICLIYGLISFLAVVILTKLYISVSQSLEGKSEDKPDTTRIFTVSEIEKDIEKDMEKDAEKDIKKGEDDA